MGEHPAPHVGGGGGHRPRRPDVSDEGEAPGPVSAGVPRIALAGVGTQARVHGRAALGAPGLAEGAVTHAQGLEQVLLGVVFPGHAREVLDDQTRDTDAVIRVCGQRAGRPHTRRLMALQVVAQRRHPIGIANEQMPHGGIFVARRVRHQMRQSDGLGKGVGDLQVRQVAADVGIEVQLALLIELHDGRPGKDLGNGPRADQAALRLHRPTLLQIVMAIASCEDGFAAVNHRHGNTHHMMGIHAALNQPVDEGRQIVSIQRVSRRCRGPVRRAGRVRRDGGR